MQLDSKPFRFGLEMFNLPKKTWRQDLKYIESTGYSSILYTDHFTPNYWEPTTSMATTAAITEKLKTGTMVYCVDYRHPIIIAKSAAMAQFFSGGRIEMGIGAGWSQEDYNQSGISMDKPLTRIRRLEESVKIIRSLWSYEKTSFSGKHYTIRDAYMAKDLDYISPPKLLIGGGGRHVLSVAGRYADIVSLIPSIPEGKLTSSFVVRASAEDYKQKIQWVVESAEKAGRDPDDIEFSVSTINERITDDSKAAYRYYADRWGTSVDIVKNCPMVLVGSVEEVKEKLCAFREETGVNYIVLGMPSMENIRLFGEGVVKELNGK